MNAQAGSQPEQPQQPWSPAAPDKIGMEATLYAGARRGAYRHASPGAFDPRQGS
jgi:hypothetical protein